MKIAFFVSSLGDTDLALKTIKSIEQKGSHETILISLTQTAQLRIDNFQSSSLVTKISLPEILNDNVNTFPKKLETEAQLKNIIQYIQLQNINYTYLGVPSVNNEIPFQIAKSLENIPVLMAYEFMFKPESHCLWNQVQELKTQQNVQWALPLADAVDDFDIDDKRKIHITGHISIDNVYSFQSDSSKSSEEIRRGLQVPIDQSLAFVSSTTQPIEIDVTFLDCLLSELPQHPNVQLRLGLHPGIQDLEAYVNEILSIYKKHVDTHHLFKIILPNDLLRRFKTPELSINDPLLQEAFLIVNINGSEASFAADRVAQAVPGALLNQAVLEGKPSYSHSGKPYLPTQYFANNIATFFSSERKSLRMKQDLGLDTKTAPERYADIIIKACSN